MAITPFACDLLTEQLKRLYMGKTILDWEGKPFKVNLAYAYDDSPDPGWIIRFSSAHLVNAPIAQTRECSLSEPLPEIWPDEPLSPCS